MDKKKQNEMIIENLLGPRKDSCQNEDRAIVACCAFTLERGSFLLSFGGMSYTQSKRPSLIAADAVLCLPCETESAIAH